MFPALFGHGSVPAGPNLAALALGIRPHRRDHHHGRNSGPDLHAMKRKGRDTVLVRIGF
jgi:hypothetical protein